MEAGKMFLVALISVVSTYAAVTAWPAIKELANPMNGSAVAATVPPPATLPTAPAVTTVSTVSRSTPAVSNSTPRLQRSTTPRTNARPLSTPRRSTIPWNYADTKYARRTVTMRATPGGTGLKAQSLNLAELRILRGTRLMPVKQKGEWVMVQAPSAIIGWVHEKELVRTRPVSSDSFKLRATD